MWNQTAIQNGANRRRQRCEIRRIPLASSCARINVAGSVHEKQVRWRANRRPLRHDRRSLPARIFGIAGGCFWRVRHLRRSGEQEADQQEREESDRAQAV